MFMVYIRFNGEHVKQEIREARTLEAAIQSATFDFIAENNIDFLEVCKLQVRGIKFNNLPR